MTDLEKITNLINYLNKNMIKKKATKKTAKKNLKSTTYTRVAPNIYKDVCGSYCVRKMVDGVRIAKSLSTIKEAKAFLNSL
jgi:hypothetical protein